MYILEFFSPEKDCPEDLKPLKEQYQKDIGNIPETASCVGCEISVIRDKYINILLEMDLDKYN